MDQYFTPDQLDVLRERRERAGPERMQAVQAEWAEIIPAVQAAMDRGADPGSPEVVALARRWTALSHEFTGGDPAMEASVRALYAREGDTLRQRHGPVPTPAMFPYIERALAADTKE